MGISTYTENPRPFPGRISGKGYKSKLTQRSNTTQELSYTSCVCGKTESLITPYLDNKNSLLFYYYLDCIPCDFTVINE